MAGKDQSDLIMKFVLPGGQAISGETQTQVTLSKGDMTTGFTVGKMFEVNTFKLKTKLMDEDPEGQKEQEAQGKRNKDIEKQNEIMRRAWERNRDRNDKTSQPNQIPIPSTSSVGNYSRWREGTMGAMKYPADIDRVSFSRALDKTSPVLLQNCIGRIVYESASLIKRKAAGGANSGEVYLRFDFNTVLVTRCDWDDDLPVTEKCEFIFRAVTIHYLPQLPNGTLGGAVQAFWTMSPDLTPFNLKG